MTTTARAITDTQHRWTTMMYLAGAVMCGLGNAAGMLARQPGGIIVNLDSAGYLTGAAIAGPLFGFILGAVVKLFNRRTSLAKWMFWTALVLMIANARTFGG